MISNVSSSIEKKFEDGKEKNRIHFKEDEGSESAQSYWINNKRFFPSSEEATLAE